MSIPCSDGYDESFGFITQVYERVLVYLLRLLYVLVIKMFVRNCIVLIAVRVDCLTQTGLLEACVCSCDEALDIVRQRCIPLVGQLQTLFEKSLEMMDVSYPLCVTLM